MSFFSYAKPHRADEGWDEVKVWQQPRWKTSELSGDEWRFSWYAKAMRKGQVVKEFVAGDLTTLLAKLTLDSTASYVPVDTKLCMQPTCAMPATELGRLVREYSPQGQRLADYRGDKYRVFCFDHKHRGDCALEDADRNYQWEET